MTTSSCVPRLDVADPRAPRTTTYHPYHTLDSHILGFTLWQLGHIGVRRVRYADG